MATWASSAAKWLSGVARRPNEPPVYIVLIVKSETGRSSTPAMVISEMVGICIPDQTSTPASESSITPSSGSSAAWAR